MFCSYQICVNWDYSPSREYTAMVYPLFEYTLIIYLVLDFMNSAVSYKKGYVSKRYWVMTKILFPIQIVLCAWFRMIFVVIAYVNLQGHTAGFLGLQICLVIVAVSNSIYVIETKMGYRLLGGVKGTKITVYVYLIGNLIIGAITIYVSGCVVVLGAYPEWAKVASGVPGLTVGRILDLIWMVFNALLPVVIAFVRSKSEKPLHITLDLPALNLSPGAATV